MFYQFWVYDDQITTEPIRHLSAKFSIYLPDSPPPRLPGQMEKLCFYQDTEICREGVSTPATSATSIEWGEPNTPRPTSTIGDNSTSLILVGSVYALPRWVSPFNVSPFQINHTKTGVTLQPLETNNYRLAGPSIVWAWTNPKLVQLYPLGAIIWSPAHSVADDILDILMSKYRVIKSVSFRVPNATLVKFVKKVYLDDRRCDRSQLSGKCKHMYPYPPKFRFVKFLVPYARLDGNRVSQTSVDLKYMIRRKFRQHIPNYVHDIIIHISDNAGHTRNMERYVDEVR